jgi:lysophospholipase L1-like esterase
VSAAVYAARAALFIVFAAALYAQRADVAVPRSDANSRLAHEQLLAKKQQGRIDLYFEGDSIVRRWGATDYPALLANWKQNFTGWNAADFGWGADRVENILWRLENGEIDGIHPKVIVLLAGTNNVGKQPSAEGIDIAASNIAQGIDALLRVMREKAPEAVIVLTAIFPRNDNLAVMPEIDALNAKLVRLADGTNIRFLNINDKLADNSGKLNEGMMNADKLHPTAKTYQIWADALEPILISLLGPRAGMDHAPPATGDPSAP